MSIAKAKPTLRPRYALFCQSLKKVKKAKKGENALAWVAWVEEPRLRALKKGDNALACVEARGDALACLRAGKCVRRGKRPRSSARHATTQHHARRGTRTRAARDHTALRHATTQDEGTRPHRIKARDHTGSREHDAEASADQGWHPGAAQHARHLLAPGPALAPTSTAFRARAKLHSRVSSVQPFACAQERKRHCMCARAQASLHVRQARRQRASKAPRQCPSAPACLSTGRVLPEAGRVLPGAALWQAYDGATP